MQTVTDTINLLSRKPAPLGSTEYVSLVAVKMKFERLNVRCQYNDRRCYLLTNLVDRPTPPTGCGCLFPTVLENVCVCHQHHDK